MILLAWFDANLTSISHELLNRNTTSLESDDFELRYAPRPLAPFNHSTTGYLISTMMVKDNAPRHVIFLNLSLVKEICQSTYCEDVLLTHNNQLLTAD